MSSSLSPSLYFEPRINEFRGHTGLRLGEAIESLLDSHLPTKVNILGASAELAIAWARHRFGANPNLKWYQDEPFGNPTSIGINADVSYTMQQVQLKLAPLDRDDVIRYLLDIRPDRCGSVIARLRSDHFSEIGCDLRIWIPLLNEMIDREFASVDELLWANLQREFERRGSTTMDAKLRILDQLKKQSAKETTKLWSLLSISTIQTRLIAEVVIEQLRRFSKTPLKSSLARDVILEVAKNVAGDPEILKFVKSCCTDDTNAMACSILHHCRNGWQPMHFYRTMLLQAQFDQADWLEVEFKQSRLSSCNFQASNLDRSRFYKSDLGHCNFSESSLRGSNMDKMQFIACSFTESDLSSSHWINGSSFNCNFSSANLTSTDWRQFKTQEARFQDADLTEAKLTESGFHNCHFEQTKLMRARADKCIFVGCRLGDAILDESVFTDCQMNGTDFEDAQIAFMRVLNSDLRGSLWTGSKLSNCTMSFCTFYQAKLAEVHWSNCDLSGADLRGVIFHFGSTRCGLVGSPYPSHGTRTGFYTDVLEEQYFKEKEQIRRAALLDCDLTRANTEGVDFYLVDLSGCKMDANQRRQAIATGALGLD